MDDVHFRLAKLRLATAELQRGSKQKSEEIIDTGLSQLEDMPKVTLGHTAEKYIDDNILEELDSLIGELLQKDSDFTETHDKADQMEKLLDKIEDNLDENAPHEM